MDAPDEVSNKRLNKKSKKEIENRKSYIARKKDLMKKRGKKVANDSKFTGRKRRTRF
jgi:18S rRNA (guanine1575-N7)-methyltransferase